MKNKDIKIRGAGISGLTAAITLAHEGYKVTVYEKRADCGMRFKGDLQGLENWSSYTNIIDELKDMGLKINFDCTPFTDMIAVSPDQQLTSFSGSKVLFYLVKRGSKPGTMDYGLKEQALELGVDIKFNSPISEDEADIVASGPASDKLCVIDTGIIFETDAEDVAYGMLDDRSAYKGYSYLLITGGYGCMCTVLFDKFPEIHNQFAIVKQRFEEIAGINIKNPTKVGGYGNFSTKNIFTKGNQLYIGEAAGLQDLLWGFGIRFAVQSGHIAARSLIEKTDYTAQAEELFYSRLRSSVVNRAIWEYLGNPGYKMFLFWGRRSKRLWEFLHNLMQYNILRKLAYPVALWDLRRRHPKKGY